VALRSPAEDRVKIRRRRRANPGTPTLVIVAGIALAVLWFGVPSFTDN
jgi:hypothetical protein